MPVDYRDVDAIAAAVADLYAEAEQALIAAMTRQLENGGFDAPSAGVWQARKLAEVRALRRTAQLLIDDLDTHGATVVRQAVADGWRSGNATALVDLTEQHIGDIGATARAAGADTAHAGARIQVLADAVVAELRPAHAAVLRSVDDTYRRAVAGATARKLTGARDLRSAVQDAWVTLARRGLTGFVDGAGRRWQLETYAEMAVRTAVARAAVAAEVDTMQAAGIDLCYVVDNPRECPLCAPWESKILALQEPATLPAVATLDDAVAAGLLHPNCFPGAVLVSAPTGVRASDARRYEGDLVVVHTAGGEELPVTPNHPVLTPEGWVAAGALEVGDYVLRHRGGDQRMNRAATGARPDDEQVPTPIGEVHRARVQASPVPPVRVPGAAEQFHGDGLDTEVEVVLTDGLLAGGELAGIGEGVHDRPLVVGGARLGSLPAQRPPLEVLVGSGHPAHGIVGRRHLRGPLLRRHARPLAPLRLTRVRAVSVIKQRHADGALRAAEPVADLGLRDALQVQGDRLGHPRAACPDADAGAAQEPAENLPADARRGRDLAQRLAPLVAADRVVKIERRRFSGHVYNLQTEGGWYIAAGLIVSNCRHQIRPWQPGVRIVAARKPDPGGYEAEQQQRAIERRLRKWRTAYAASLDDSGRQRAARRIAAAAHTLAAHLDAHPRLPRKTHREHPGAGFRAPRTARTRRDAAHLASRS